MMAELVALLEALRVPFWADYGTLLGAVRNPLLGLPAGIIPHDKDADMGILGMDLPTMYYVKRKLDGKGFDVMIRPRGRSFKVRLSRRNHTNIDCFIWRPGRDGKLHRDLYLQVDQFKGREFPATWVQPLSTVEWEGMTLPAPTDPAAFCAFRYGPSWMTPIAANHAGVRRP
jgi:phosphorylcholine metabolism protein LicD